VPQFVSFSFFVLFLVRQAPADERTLTRTTNETDLLAPFLGAVTFVPVPLLSPRHAHPPPQFSPAPFPPPVSHESSSQPAPGAVFLSYASQDAEAALRLCAALRAAGVEVWFDQNELVGGDAWDAKIRKQIAECALFLPVISANTQARLEGYFRIEWKLAARRTHAMATAKAFLLPVVIDATRDAEAHVPDEFRDVQWTRLPGAEAPEKFCARVQTLLGSAGRDASPRRPASDASENSGRLGETSLPPKSSRPWLLPAMIAGAAIAALAIWQPWKAPGRPSLSVQPAAPATPDSKTAGLVARARAIYETGLIANEEELKLAERFAREATEVEPFNAEAWAARALASAQIFDSRFDASDVRRAEVLTAAQRAVKLDPASATAKLALAASLSLSRDTEPEAGRIAQALAARPDASGMALLLQAKLLVAARDTAGAAPLFERLLAMPGFAAQAHFWKGVGQRRAGRFPEAAIEFARAIALEPLFAVAQGGRLEVLLTLADREELRRALAALPAQLKTDSRLAGELFMVHWQLRDGDQAARAFESLPQEYIEAGFLTGPKAMYLGLAHRVAGRREAAVVEWQGALRTVDKRLASGKTDPGDVLDRALLLALLGREAEALDSLRLYEQLIRRSVGRPTTITVYVYAELGQEELVWVFFDRHFSAKDAGPGMASAYLLSDCFDRYRELPRFREINRRAEELVANARLPAGTAKTVPTPAAAVAAQAAEKSVAVLAFKNLSGDPAREFFSDGLSEAVTDVLGRVPGLKVVGSASAFSFKGKSVPIPEIARQLGVTHLVDGTVIQDGPTVRITAKLIQADGFQVWVSDKLDRELKNIFALHDEVAGLIAKNLSLKLGASSAASTAAVNPQAYEFYIQARQAWNLRTPEGYDRAELLLKQAVGLEPNFARAHAQLADVWLTRGADLEPGGGTFSWRDSPTIRRVRKQAELAVSLDANSAEAFTSLSNVTFTNWQFEESLVALRHALTLNPNYSTARQWLGDTLAKIGRLDESLVETARATETEPLSFIVWNNHAQVLMSAGKFEAALAAYDRAQGLAPTAVQSGRARVLARLGRIDDSLALLNLPGERWNNRDMWKAEILVRAGREQEARQMVADAKPEQKFWGLLALRQPAEAAEFLSLANFDVNSLSLYHTLYDAMVDPVRSDPRFQNMLATLGLTEAHARAQAWRAAHPPEKAVAKP
jgi:TolB-like protein/Flp pilus assembly protein TadD